MFQNRCPALRHTRFVAVALIAAVVSGCASKPLNVPYNPQNFGPPDPVQVAKVADVITAGDKLKVTVFGVDSLSGDFQVEENGMVDFPLIGLIQAQGQTPEVFAKALATRLGERDLRNPDVRVAVAERAQQTITIEGAVKQPAVVPIRNQTSLLQAIALAGGTSEDANTSQIVVFRKVGGQRMAAAFDLKAIRRAEAPDPIIYPNDMVVVSGSQNKRLVDRIFQAVPILGIFRPF